MLNYKYDKYDKHKDIQHNWTLYKVLILYRLSFMLSVANKPIMLSVVMLSAVVPLLG